MTKCRWEQVMDDVRNRGLKSPMHVIVTDGDDERVVQAVKCLYQANPNAALRITLLCRTQTTPSDLSSCGSNVQIVVPAADPHTHMFTQVYREQRHRAGKPVPTYDEAFELMMTNEMYAAMALSTGHANGMLGGASVPTAQVLRAGLRIVGLKDGRTTVSGAFMMLFSKPLPGGQDMIAFADCAVVPVPTSRQLAEITLNTADTVEEVFDLPPVVAFLSFSTKRSAQHDSLQKIDEALFYIHQTRPSLIADGELQADAAIVPDIAARKDTNGVVRGAANVLIFPDLNAGNISYKLVSCTSGAKALGVILSGFSKPVNDLSRGCSTVDVMDMICVTSLQAVAHDRLDAVNLQD